MLTHLAAPRIAPVKSYFQTSSNHDLLGCYAWCQAVSSGLLPILGDFEVSLRNALHRAFSQHYGKADSFDWMMTRPHPAAARNPKAKPLPAPHRMGPKAQKDIEKAADKVRIKKGCVTPDDMVAALPFGFWEQLIKALDHRSQPEGTQSAILSKVFPYAPDLANAPHGSPAFKDRIVALLTQIREVRNRIGHHDAIWGVPEFSRHGVVGFYPRLPRHTINSLKQLASHIAWFVGWIDPAITEYIRNSDHWWSFQSLLSREALAVYRMTGGRIGTYERILRTQLQSESKRLRQTSRKQPLNFQYKPLYLLRFHY